MEADALWETALDAVADEIQRALEQGTLPSVGQDAPPSTPTVRVWMDMLVDLLGERQRAQDPEGASEVLDVLAMLLIAIAEERWSQRLEVDNEEGGIYASQRIQTIVEALVEVSSHGEEIEDSLSQAVTICGALIINAAHEEEVGLVAQALQSHVPRTALARAISLAKPLPEDGTPDANQWAACLIRLAMIFFRAHEKETAHEAERFTTLSLLTGTGDMVKTWIDTTWETKWHLNHSSAVMDWLLGSGDDCVASIRRVFRGFSVGQEDEAPPSPPTEAATFMALRYANRQLGLVHGVDVTFIKGGQVHPAWKDTSQRIGLGDVDSALRDGYSVGVRGLQTRSLAVFELCDKLQRELGQHINANLYWTPPRQQGFDLHIDDHCVFAIQLKGKKRWVLHESQGELPRLYDDTVTQLAARAPRVCSEVILEEGDVLYVPRGVAHYADTKDMGEESIHLTIGVEIEADYTNARVLEEWKKAEPRRTDPACTARDKSRGLMAWHLNSDKAFLDHVASLFGSPVGKDDVSAIRVALSDERALFLQHRSMRARAMATLHEAARGGLRNKPVEASSSTSRPSKKQRL